MHNMWNVIRDRKIISYLNGDLAVYTDFLDEYKMPYLSGSDICNFSKMMGFNNNYNSSDKKSRWQYMDELLEYVIKNDKIDKFLKSILDIKRFKNIERASYNVSIIDQYWTTIQYLFIRINEELVFEKCHIEYNFDDWNFILVDDEKDYKLQTSHINEINFSYIKRLKNEIYNSIECEDYESCITKSRTLIEEILLLGIESKNEAVDSKGNIDKLFSKFKTLYQMHQSKEIDNRINELLGGFEKVIHSISDMRNIVGDSHGKGSNRIKIKKHHAILVGNSSLTMAEFLLFVIENNNKN